MESECFTVIPSCTTAPASLPQTWAEWNISIPCQPNPGSHPEEAPCNQSEVDSVPKINGLES